MLPNIEKIAQSYFKVQYAVSYICFHFTKDPVNEGVYYNASYRYSLLDVVNYIMRRTFTPSCQNHGHYLEDCESCKQSVLDYKCKLLKDMKRLTGKAIFINTSNSESSIKRYSGWSIVKLPNS